MEDAVSRAQERVRDLADEYHARGFEVTVNPAPSQLPPFLAGYHPDLLVRREGQAMIIEVKSRRSLSTEAEARRIADLIEGNEGWSFELVTLDEHPDIVPPGVDAFDAGEARRNLEEARELYAEGRVRASLLVAWSAFEAILRLVMESEGIIPKLITPSHLTKLAVAEGLLSRDDYRAIAEIMRQRNALAHGYREPEVSHDSVRHLVEISEQLLNEMPSEESA